MGKSTISMAIFNSKVFVITTWYPQKTRDRLGQGHELHVRLAVLEMLFSDPPT